MLCVCVYRRKATWDVVRRWPSAARERGCPRQHSQPFTLDFHPPELSQVNACSLSHPTVVSYDGSPSKLQQPLSEVRLSPQDFVHFEEIKQPNSPPACWHDFPFPFSDDLHTGHSALSKQRGSFSFRILTKAKWIRKSKTLVCFILSIKLPLLEVLHCSGFA